MVLSPVGDVKIVSSISTFVLNTLTLKKSACFFFSLRVVLCFLAFLKFRLVFVLSEFPNCILDINSLLP